MPVSYKTILAAAVLLVTAASCRQPFVEGSGPSQTDTRQLSGSITGIDISAPVDAEISVVPGATPSVSITGYANVLPYIKTSIEDGQLNIEVKEEVNLHTGKNLVAHITLPSLDALSISGSSDAKISGDVTGNELKLDLTGGGSVSIASLNVSELNADVTGSADITIQGGKTGTATYDISGSGDIHAYGLRTTNTNVEITGSGSAEVAADGKLDASISGSGGVTYKGNPAVSQDISGSGSVEAAR